MISGPRVQRREEQRRDERDFCGCCGCETQWTDVQWCDPCLAHIDPDSGKHPAYRTYFAQHRVDCPFQVRTPDLDAFAQHLIEHGMTSCGPIVAVREYLAWCERPDRPKPCGDHKPVQHRDGKPAWCERCGLTAEYVKPERLRPRAPLNSTRAASQRRTARSETRAAVTTSPVVAAARSTQTPAPSKPPTQLDCAPSSADRWTGPGRGGPNP